MARIPPPAPAQWSPELRASFAEYRTRVHRGGPAPADTRSGTNLLGTSAGHPELTMAFLPFNGHLLSGGTLPDRHRELLILRVAKHRDCDYEWAQHTVLGGHAGLTPYAMLAMALRTFEVQPEPDLAPYLPAKPGAPLRPATTPIRSDDE